MLFEGKLPEEWRICHLNVGYDRKSTWFFPSLCSLPLDAMAAWEQPGFILFILVSQPVLSWWRVSPIHLSVPSGFLWKFPAFYHKGGQKCLRKWQFLRQPHLTISSINQEETKEENGKQMLGAGQGYEWLMLRAGQGYEWSKRQGRIYSRRDLSLGLRQLPMQEFITAKWWQGARNGFLGECPVQ